jgi:hypothetical protein
MCTVQGKKNCIKQERHNYVGCSETVKENEPYNGYKWHMQIPNSYASLQFFAHEIENRQNVHLTRQKKKLYKARKTTMSGVQKPFKANEPNNIYSCICEYQITMHLCKERTYIFRTSEPHTSNERSHKKHLVY